MVKSKKLLGGDMMLPEALQLEKLRQEIEDLQNEIKNHTDYIDHGLPRQSRKVVKMREQSEQAKAKLRSAIDLIRREKPEAFAEWINYHKGILEQILTEQATTGIPAQRLIIARVILSNWEKVLSGENEFVYVGSFPLEDYHAKVTNLFPQDTKKSTPSQNTKKSWWQFLKWNK